MKIIRLVTLAILLGACTLVGLSREIERAHCSDDRDCDSLNRDDPHPCEPYQCSAAQLCERAPLDRDRDGLSPDGCLPTAQVGDCDDSDPDVFPGAAERCNGRDDDCDLRNDEGLLEQTASTVLRFGTPTAVSSLSFAPANEESTLTVGYVLERARGQAAIAQLEAESRATSSALPLKLPRTFGADPRATSLALGRLADSGTAVASFVQDEVPRVLAGSFDWPATALGVSPQIARYGLACASSEPCARNAEAPEIPVATPPSSHFAVASGEGSTLIVYARDPETLDGETSATSVAYARAPRQLLANLLVRGAYDLPERTGFAHAIALTPDRDAAGVVFVPRGAAHEARGFLVAFADESGALVLYQLRPTRTGIERSPQLLSLPARGSDWHSPQLALGHRTAADSFEIGVVATRGWNEAARVVALRLSAQFDDDGIAQLRALGEPLTLDDTPSQHAPTLAWNGLKQAWGMAFRDGSGVRTRILNVAFQPIGPALALAPSAALYGELADALAIVPLTSQSGFFGVFHQAPGDDGIYSLQRTEVAACTRP